ncbi:hypothetical protein KVT40_003734 [Elsinoe batatas]|uniref:Uncharacterized protein n=1 Tax=Elsinoe batatas TaxID=2601811 RepID=A0A8K0L543_9PEZI|nr:hypothetical protein KVT40_003734 [Elsinoe batatas]
MANLEPRRSSVPPVEQEHPFEEVFRMKHNQSPHFRDQLVDLGITQAHQNTLVRENNRRTVSIYRDHEFLSRLKEAVKADPSKPLYERITDYLVGLREESRAMEKGHVERMYLITTQIREQRIVQYLLNCLSFKTLF